MSFRRRTYPELMDNILTRLIGGIAAESYPFPPANSSEPPYQHPLERPPVKKITSVYGLRNGSNYAFKQEVDFMLVDEQVLEWIDGGALPDKGSTFQVNYFSGATSSPVTDIHVGSVARTLMEAAALEMAGLYAQMQVVYDAGFIDTATGKSLDHVVALLGVERALAGYNTVTLEFKRSPGSKGEIFIPAGTRVLSEDATFEYETTAEVKLVDGQTSVKVTGRDLLPANDPIIGGQLSLLAKPISGIEGVSNPDASTLSEQDESDESLRTRARNFLHNSEKATLAAIKNVITRQKLLADVVEHAPGEVEITFHSGDLTPERKKEIEKAIDDVRPAGILMSYQYASAPQSVNIEMRLTTDNSLLTQELRAIQDQVRTKITDYFSKLEVKADGSMNKLIGMVLSDARIQDVRILSVTVDGSDVLNRESGIISLANNPTELGDLTITDPNLPTVLQVSVSFPKNFDSVDQTQIETALTEDIAYLNELNAVEINAGTPPEELARRDLNFGRLALAIPLPSTSRLSLQDFDSVIGTPESPDLPTEEDLGNYEVQWSFVTETGMTYLITDEASTPYQLSPFERLTLGGVEIHVTAPVEEPVDG
ncbi:baseplate J/gp47 family protein [Hahella ganghwensis]|uniref:baseplate J/gp47 family protein n=1 Tax=Hahella ganghwensis TaxID=286420 RepID=UPI00037F99AE|nr:baseplate J/gp47 family protein [Hahella ganghwensis]